MLDGDWRICCAVRPRSRAGFHRVRLYQFYLGVASRPIRDDYVDAPEPSAFDRKLAALRPQIRQAFLLTTVEGFSQDEAAAIMGVDSGAFRPARTRRTRSRA